MEENNRLKDDSFELPPERPKKRKLAFALISCLSVFLLEICSITVLYTYEIYKQRPVDAFFDQFILSRVVLAPFVSGQHSAFVRRGKQRYIGDLKPGSLNWRKFLAADSLLGWKVEKSVKATISGKYILISNDQGFLSIGEADFYYRKSKPSDVYRVIVVGGSTVFGLGAYTPKENLPAQIYEHLKESNPGFNFEVINAGRGGYASNQELLYIMSELVYYQPDLIIIYDGWNDLYYNNILLDKYGENLIPLKSLTHYELEKRMNESYSIWGSFSLFLGVVKGHAIAYLDEIGFYNLLKRTLRRIAGSGARYKYFPRSVEMYRANLETMVLLAQYHDFKLGLFLQPIMGVDQKPLSPDERAIPVGDIDARIAFYRDTGSVKFFL